MQVALPHRPSPNTIRDAPDWLRLPRRWRRLLRFHALQRATISCLLIASCVVATQGLTRDGLSRDSLSGAMARVEDSLAHHGFALEQVSLNGHRFTPDGDLYEALRLSEAKTLIGFDTRTAKARLEALPWVEKALLQRKFPHTLDVTIHERHAVAIWHTETGAVVLDATGRKLAAIPRDASHEPFGRNLLHLTGATAGAHIDEALRLLSAFPGVAHRLKALEHVAGRRWTLHLDDGRQILLPADNPADGLRRALDLERQGHLAGAFEIDVRHGQRTVLIPPRPRTTPNG